MRDLKIGMVGLDTSHAAAFTRLLNDPDDSHHVRGGKVVKAFPGGSPHIELSSSRIAKFTKEVQGHGVQIVDSLEEAAEGMDAILLESVDGDIHLEQLRKLVVFKKPIFIDKPFSLRTEDALEMVRLAEHHHTPIMSTSALRFAEALREVASRSDLGNIIGADCFGPMELEDSQPGYFWYGIHSIEMLFTLLGGGAERVTVFSNDTHDSIVAQWKDGKFGTVRGNRAGNDQFGALVHFEKGTEYVDIQSGSKPFYASLVEEIMEFFQAGISRVPCNETLEVIRFIEGANESRETGRPVSIK
ncbi:Gfo/Idh/MocA family protein [Rossellomorea aquimaris]|uniref:Gfo/Idh/MocA family protein n=1 Tax=Rossellomorea aquimaris TaxID=189382 RepID=UPI001CFE4469|nr:Gfo/Idh/MocA family oxidoreductase [Rossellomorea aquimaris]